MEPIYVTGHRNPDTDSIVSAMAYAALRNALGDREFVPARLGHISDETRLVLGRFGFEPPIRIQTMRTQVRDLDYDTPPALSGARLTVSRAPDRAGRRVIVQIAHLRAHGLDAHRRLEAEAVEHEPCLIGDMPQTRGNEFPIAQRVSQRGIGHGGNNGIGIGIAVAGDIDGFHEKPPYARGNSIP